MVFISRLKLRNFKSFRIADVQLPKTFICFAGPNGSGKSNLCDAIRFVMGEKSLKSLRAKKVKDLIHTGAKAAEVTIVMEDEGGKDGYEIRRAIREDGKIRYRLNGKKTTRSAVLETLKKNNLDESGRNTIAQGEVQRIINMNGKERRTIIDSVAGIADFEQKKNEAKSELETVETRIKEARLVVGERRAFLEELGKEKEVAIRYTKAKKALNNAKGTMLKRELERIGSDLNEITKTEERLNNLVKASENEITELDGQIVKIETERAKLSLELQSKQKTNVLIRKLEELKASSSARKQLIEDKKTSLKAMKDEISDVEKQIAEDKKTLRQLEDELNKLFSEFKEVESKFAGSVGAGPEDRRVLEARKALEHQEHELGEIKEKTIVTIAEIGTKKSLAEAKLEEIKSLKMKVGGDGSGDATSGEEDNHNQIPKLKREIDNISKDIEQLFGKTKGINLKIASLDQQMLEVKEKASILKIRSSPQLANPALSFIADIIGGKSIHGKTAGVYGTVADLISFDPKYSNAVEAAGGARLFYVVVDSIDTATEIIEKLKKARVGRATFIPLDTIKTQSRASSSKHSSIIDVIECKTEVLRAIEYLFSDTLLVETVSDARKVGVGSARMVTLEGEIFERSGIISGGRNQTGILSANQLKKIESELEDIKAEKEALIQELYSIREHESKLRAEKSRVEILVKTIEMKEKLQEEKRKGNEHIYKRMEDLGNDIDELRKLTIDLEHEASKLKEASVEKEKQVEEFKEKLKTTEEEFRKISSESSQKRADIGARVSELKATIEGKKNEMEIRKRELKTKEEKLKKLDKEEKDGLEKIEEARKEVDKYEKELLETEEKLSSTSKEIEKLFETIKTHESEIEKVGKKRGHVKIELERINKDVNQATIKKVTNTTRLEDIKIEFASYNEFEELDKNVSKEQLSKWMQEAETEINDLGTSINMAAIDMYDKKKAEIEEAESKIGKLDTEREAILAMIDEIDEHKKEAFLETFNSVSTNFTKMFQHINVGQGHLSLSDPANPFESGLFIKLRRSNHEHALDALSGGEKTLVALMFIFALQLFKPAPFYILDEVDAALDKPNSKNLADLVGKMSKDSQFIMVSHNDMVMSNSESVIGVTKVEGTSKLVGIKIKQTMAQKIEA